MIEFWLSYNNGEEKLRLPVPPASFRIQRGTTINVINVNNVGEVGVIGKGRLATISLASFFPKQRYPFVQYSNFPAPYDCVAMIEKWRNSGKPIRLLITGTDINMACMIEAFQYGEQDGTGDVYFELSLIEYRFITVKATEKTTSAQQIASSRQTKDKETLYTVKSGDTLWAICKRCLGDGSKYVEVAKKNGIKDPNKLRVGQVIKL